jgi:hypothetical protein
MIDEMGCLYPWRVFCCILALVMASLQAGLRGKDGYDYGNTFVLYILFNSGGPGMVDGGY